MNNVNIAKLKSELSKYLRLVKEGQIVVVYDRNEPVAEIVPIQKKNQDKMEQLLAEGKITRKKTPSEDVVIPKTKGADSKKILADFLKFRDEEHY